MNLRDPYGEMCRERDAQMALERDAERWRWFRENWARVVFHTTFDLTSHQRICLKIEHEPKLAAGFGPSLDKAVDEARTDVQPK